MSSGAQSGSNRLQNTQDEEKKKLSLSAAEKKNMAASMLLGSMGKGLLPTPPPQAELPKERR